MIVLAEASTDLTPGIQLTIQLLQFPHRPKDKFEVRVLTESGPGIQKNTKRFRDFQTAEQAYKAATIAWGL